MTNPNFETVSRAKDYVLSKVGQSPRISIVMGSGISASDELLSNVVAVPYSAIPGFPVPSVEGHRGQIVAGRCGSNSVMVFEGRVHYYEGWTMAETTFPIRVMGAIGVETVLLTNAAGAVNTHFEAGQLMMIVDHINCLGENPLRGPNESRWGPRFPDLSEVYSVDLRERLKASATRSGVRLLEGVYAAMLGPSYETPAEIRFLRTIGADAVGMSTVPEAIVARHMGMKVCGISMLSNMAAGITGQPLSHEEVLAAGKKMQGDLSVLLQDFVENYD